MNMYLVWAIAIIAFGIFEGITAQLVSVWFIVGSVAALAATALGAPLWVQFTVFFAVSLVVLAALRPIVKKRLSKSIEKTNADRCIGEDGIVTEEINNLLPTGQVKTDGKLWTARSSDQSIIPEGSIVKVEKIDGVKLIVSPK